MENEVRNDSPVVNETPVQNEAPVLNSELESSTTNQGTPTPVPEMSGAKENAFTRIIAKIKSFGLVPVIAIAAFIVLLVGGVVLKVSTSSPKAVFKNTINGLYKEMSKEINDLDKIYNAYDIKEKALLVKGDMKFDTNLEELKETDINFKDLTFGGEVGIDINKEQMQVAAFVKGKKEELKANVYYVDGKGYMSSNLFDELVALEEELDVDFSEFKDMLDELEEEGIEFDAKKYNSVLKSVEKALIKSLDSEKMKKEKEEIEVAGTELKATKHSYKLDDKAIQDIVKTISETLLDDKNFINNLSEISGVDKSEIKDTLKEMKSGAKDIEFKNKFYFNIYTKGLFNKVIGASITFDGDEYFSVYNDGKNIELIVDNHSESYSKTKLVVTAEKEKDEYNVIVKYNDEKIATATVRELTDEVIDFDFEVESDGEKAKGTIYLSCKEEKAKFSGEYKFRMEYEEQYVEVEGSYGIEPKDSLDKIDTDKAKSIDEIDEKAIEEKLEKMAENDEVFKNIYDELVKAEEESLNLNSYSMSPLTSIEDVKKVLAKSQGTILYVGKTYYQTGTPEAKMFADLVALQSELKFHSYYYSEFYVEDEFKTLLSDFAPSCQNQVVPEVTPNVNTPVVSDCKEYPVVYLIKDGKVVKALRGNVTKETLKEELKAIGIE